MLASTMPPAVAQALRACGRTLPAAKSVTHTGLSSGASRVLVRRTFLIPSTSKARIAVRGYATATATATKKAPATKATKARTTGGAQKKAPATKKSTTTAKTKAKATSKAKPKAKAKAPKKPALKKKPRAKKELTPEKKAALAKRELKKIALLTEEPKKASTSAWITYVGERLQHEKDVRPGKEFGGVMRGFSTDFKALTPSEKARIEQKILDNTATSAANYKKWVETHTVEDIYKANLARNRLAREHNRKTRKITDDRMPKRPTTAFAHFVKAKMTGANVGNGILAAIKDVGTEWKSLSPTEKKPYEDLHAADKLRYVKEAQASGLSTAQVV